MGMSDKEFKQQVILSLCKNPMLHDIAKVAQTRKLSISEMLVDIASETCGELNRSIDKPNQ